MPIPITKTEDDGSGNEVEREIPFMKGYTVFNVEQIEGLPEHYYVKPEVQTTTVERIAHAEAFFAATGADIRYRGDRAFYSADGDYIQMPVIEAFRDAESFYATLAHESAHWTKHPSRLDRDFGRKTLGRRRLCPRGTRGRARQCVPVRRSWHHAGSA